VVSAGWALAHASRLAVLRWLAAYSPDPLDGELLEMECAVLQARLSPLLPDPGAAPSVRKRALELVAAMSRAESHGIPEVFALAAEYLAVLATAGDEQAADALQSRPDAAADTPGAMAGARRWDRRSVLTPMAAGMTLDDKTEPVIGAWSEGPTDWDLIPRGAFDSDETAIRWRLESESDGQHRILIDAAAGWDPRGQYMARLHSETVLMPLGLVPLVLDGERWRGASPLHGPAPDPSGCWVDITSSEHPRRARRGDARTAAEARRWAIRAVARLRYGLVEGVLLASTSPIGDAVGCLERSRMAYASLATHPDGAGSRSRHFELGLVLRAALERSGEHHEVDDLTQELASEAAALERSDIPHVPGMSQSYRVDLSHPAWSLSVAELGLLVPAP
jgi:hypothetical protein